MSDPFDMKREVFADPEALSWRVADWMLEIARAKAGEFSVCLSGGSTPQRLYQRLADPRLRESFPWPRTHWFWGDERFVSHEDALSNYRMVREALLSHAPIPPGNIHAVSTELVTPDESAFAYERELKSFYHASSLDPLRPLFDVTLLGLGPDGHLASLFPNTAVLGERDRWVAAVVGAKAEARVTLTYPALESSRYVAFLVVGEEKREILRRFRSGDKSLPATHLRPTGQLWLFTDKAAAGSSGN